MIMQPCTVHHATVYRAPCTVHREPCTVHINQRVGKQVNEKKEKWIYIKRPDLNSNKNNICFKKFMFFFNCIIFFFINYFNQVCDRRLLVEALLSNIRGEKLTTGNYCNIASYHIILLKRNILYYKFQVEYILCFYPHLSANGSRCARCSWFEQR